jgi:hypothetical protein
MSEQAPLSAASGKVCVSRATLEQLIEDAMSHLAYWGDDNPPPSYIVEARETLGD